MFKEFGIHGSYGRRGVFEMAADNRVAVLEQDNLPPCHVNLCQGAAAPLASFEQYDANRTA